MTPEEIAYLIKISDSLERIADSLEKRDSHMSDISNLSETSEKPRQSKNNFLSNSKEELIFKEKNEDNYSQYFPILEDFLNKKGIFIDDIRPDDEYYAIMETLSNFLGNNYSNIKPFLERIKSSMNRSGSVSMSLKNYSQNQVSNICQWATLLYQNAFLTDYSYKKSPAFYLYARLNKEGNVMNFFSGDWLENYVSISIKEIINEINFKYDLDIEYHIFNNIHITLDNGDKFELDKIVIIDEKLFFWIECKSSDYQSHIHKYSNFAKKYAFEKDESYIVLSEVDSVISSNLTSLFGLHVIALQDFKEDFYYTILEYLGISEEVEKDMDILDSD